MYYIFLERQHNPDLVVGPYETKEEAALALDYSVVIDGLAEQDCLDCYLVDDEELQAALSNEDFAEKLVERMTVRRDNPDFFGRKISFDDMQKLVQDVNFTDALEDRSPEL